MRPRAVVIPILTSCLLLCGCLSPDPPLLTTPLPGDHAFFSNGGEYGYIVAPGRGRLAEWFGIRDDGDEYWCGDVGWAKTMVVCRYEQQLDHGIRDAGFFVFDTADGSVTIAGDESEALVALRAAGVTAMPTLKRHPVFDTTRRR